MNDQQMQLFCERLGPPEEWLVLARLKIQEVFQHIQQKSKYKVDRCKIVGGMAKKTSTFIKVDVDTIIYYNDDKGAYKMDDILSDWERVLLCNTNLKKQDIHKAKKLLTFRYDGIPIDLVAVRNKATSANTLDQEKMQQMNEYAEAKRSNNVEVEKDLSLSGPNVNWMDKKNKLSHDIARLAKFWSQTILFHHKVSGMSLMFEHIAVKAVEEMLHRKPHATTSYVEAFKQFLEKVKGIRKLRLIFTDEYKESDVSKRILQQVPLLVDCVNPWRNLLDINDVVKANFFKVFSKCAQETSKRFRSHQNIFDIFMLQPTLADYPFKITKPLNTSFLVGIINDEKILIPKREDRDTPTKEEKSTVESILHVWAATLATLPPGLSEKELESNAQVVIRKLMTNMAQCAFGNWQPGMQSNKQFTLRIPIDKGRVVVISFDLDPKTK